MMVESLLVAGAVGFVSGGVGILVGHSVVKERVSNLTTIVKKHDKSLQTLSTLPARVASHSAALARAVYKDKCVSCAELDVARQLREDERYDRLASQFDALSAPLGRVEYKLDQFLEGKK